MQTAHNIILMQTAHYAILMQTAPNAANAILNRTTLCHFDAD